MPRMSDPALLLQPQHAALTVRTHTTAQDLPLLVGTSYKKIADYLEKTGAMLTDLPFVAYHCQEADRLEVEVGFPVDRELPGTGEVVCAQVPARRMAYCMYRGTPYRMESAVEELRDYIRQQGATACASVYESYYNDLHTPGEELLARIAIPLD